MSASEFLTLEDAIHHWREKWTIPGIVVGIYRSGDVSLFADGVGSIVTGDPMRGDNLFRIASITKVFTATVAMSLVDQGTLELDRPIKTYLPKLRLVDPAAENGITMRHLLIHASGLYGDVFDDYGQGDDALSRFVRDFQDIRQLTPPGELWHYCNSGFDLAGFVVERVLDTNYETAVRERIFEPLGMERSGFFVHEMIVYPHAVGHTPVEPLSDEHRVEDQYYPRNNSPSGAVISNAEELLRFAAMHLGDGALGDTGIISAESARAMREPQIESGDFAELWGIGWEIRNFGGTTVYGHGGSTNGFQSQLTLIPEHQFALCIWTNSGRGRLAINPIEEWILKQEFGLEKREPEPVELPAEQLQRLAGTYSQPLSEIVVEVEDGALRLRMWTVDLERETTTELPETLARPLSPDRFVVLDGVFRGEMLNFFPRGAEQPGFLRRHGRLHEQVNG